MNAPTCRLVLSHPSILSPSNVLSVRCSACEYQASLTLPQSVSRVSAWCQVQSGAHDAFAAILRAEDEGEE